MSTRLHASQGEEKKEDPDLDASYDDDDHDDHQMFKGETDTSSTSCEKKIDNSGAVSPTTSSAAAAAADQMIVDKLVVWKSKSAAMAVRWCLDRDAEVCFGCRDDFSLFVRKHHCRSCGGVFCGSCSRFQKTLPMLGYDTPTRVCGFCYQDEEDKEDKENSGSRTRIERTKKKNKNKNPLSSLSDEKNREERKEETTKGAGGAWTRACAGTRGILL